MEYKVKDIIDIEIARRVVMENKPVYCLYYRRTVKVKGMSNSLFTYHDNSPDEYRFGHIANIDMFFTC